MGNSSISSIRFIRQAVYLESEYNRIERLVDCSRTEWAYDNLLEGKADIIFCGKPSEKQLSLFYENGINLNFIAIGREAFVFFVNKKNPVNNLTIENIHGIYSGKIRNWKELKGFDRNIRAFQRPGNSGSQIRLEKIMGDIPIMTPRREHVIADMGTVIKSVVADYRNFPNAIGYSFLYFAAEMEKNDQIKLLSIDGVYPSRETIQNNSYPFSNDFYAIYIETDKKNENIELFIEWILSDQGQGLIQKTGYVPINN